MIYMVPSVDEICYQNPDSAVLIIKYKLED